MKKQNSLTLSVSLIGSIMLGQQSRSSVSGEWVFKNPQAQRRQPPGSGRFHSSIFRDFYFHFYLHRFPKSFTLTHEYCSLKLVRGESSVVTFNLTAILLEMVPYLQVKWQSKHVFIWFLKTISYRQERYHYISSSTPGPTLCRSHNKTITKS